ncbi:MAG TPA: DHA2 family efflux MFS transporter permease subunit [Thermomicrobiales bacterium]|nr:DHA2 family efflux MFS transporter permease subunit [Thermomicrobiales bacterium]
MASPQSVAVGADRERPGSQRGVLAALGLGVFMAALDLTIVTPAFPVLERELHVSARAIAWVIGIYALCNIVGQPTLAAVADRRGRRLVFLASVTAFGAGSFVAALSRGMPLLLAARAIQGFGAGGIFPTANAMVPDVFPPERRGLAYGVTGSLWGVAAVIGPSLGGFLTQHASWHWIFLVNVPLALLVATVGLRTLPGSPPARRGRFDIRGVAFLTLAVVGLMGALNGVRGDDLWRSLASPEVLGAAALFVVAAALFVVAERRAPAPVVPFRLYRSRELRIADGLGAVAGLVESGLVFLPTFAVVALGFSTEASGYFLTPVALTLGFATPVVGRVLDRSGPRPVLIAGTLTTAAALLFLGTAVASPATFLLALIVGGIGLASLLGTPLRYMTANAVAPEERATGMALLSIATNVGIAAGSALLGAIIASRPADPEAGLRWAYLTLAVIAAAAALPAAFIPPRPAQHAPEATAPAETLAGR